jgi:hypothetical protein
MNRRNFLGLLAGGLAATAAVRTFPFRVFSFPKRIRLANAADYGLFWEDWQRWAIGNSDLPVMADGMGMPRSLHGLPYYIGDEDHPLTTGTMFGIQRAQRPIICTDVDPVKHVITWSSD